MLRQMPQFLYNRINGMFSSVQQNKIQIGEIFHFLSHQRLHRDAAIRIIRDKSNMFCFGIERTNHTHIISYIIMIDKSRLQFRNIHMIFKDIYRSGQPAIQISDGILRQYHDIAADQTTHYRNFHPHRIPLRQISRPRLLS